MTIDGVQGHFCFPLIYFRNTDEEVVEEEEEIGIDSTISSSSYIEISMIIGVLIFLIFLPYIFTLMLLVAKLAKLQNIWKMTETLAHGYSPESTQLVLSNEYQHDRV